MFHLTTLGAGRGPVHKAESSAQETLIKDHLLVGREALQLEAERSSERPELFAGGRCGGTRLFLLFTS